jgi:hypothetical protein
VCRSSDGDEFCREFDLAAGAGRSVEVFETERIQVPILPEVTNIGFHIFVITNIFTFYIFITFD